MKTEYPGSLHNHTQYSQRGLTCVYATVLLKKMT